MRRLRDEDGVVALWVGIMLVMLFGLAAISVDVAAAYQERRELQNGADGGSLAIAEECANGLLDCAGEAAPVVTDCIAAGTVTTTAKTYADANAADGASDPECVQLDLVSSPNSVTVTTRTEDGDSGDNLLDFAFAPVIGVDDTTVRARATAVWGAPTSLGTAPLTLSVCEYDDATTSGVATKNDTPPPEYDNVNEVTMIFHQGTSSDEDPCAAPPSGQDTDGDGKLPAGFGWLETTADCEIVTSTVDGEDWVHKDGGNDVTAGCKEPTGDVLAAALGNGGDAATWEGKVVVVPIFDDFCKADASLPEPCTSNPDKYHVQSYRAFRVTGYRLGGPKYQRGDTSGDYSTSVPCSPPQACIRGFFTTATITEGEPGGTCEDVCIIKLTN